MIIKLKNILNKHLALRAIIWLAVLGPSFFLLYGNINHYTATRPNVGSYVYEWEKNIPFIPMLMLPYMSIDLFYAVSLFLFRTKKSLDTHAKRLFSALIISCVGFLLFPLRFSFKAPEVSGFNGKLIEILHGFDLPFNQAPSLHISLLIILWVAYLPKLKTWLKPLLHFWFSLIGLSVLVCYQHHFIDVWTGTLVGMFCIYIFPQENTTTINDKATHNITIAKNYWASSLLLLLISYLTKDYMILTIINVWGALSLMLVGMAYMGHYSRIFQFTQQKLHPLSFFFLTPYLIGAKISYYYFTKNLANCTEILPNLWLGCYPKKDKKTWYASIDLSCELYPYSTHIKQRFRFPCLDLIAPSTNTIILACQKIQEIYPKISQDQPLLIHCALGLQRSACIIATWLVWQKKVDTIEQAFVILRQKRPGVCYHEMHVQHIKEALIHLTKNNAHYDSN
jgi:membrane-associated phospholipid phosphatase